MVVFDLDGTLVDSGAAIASCLRATMTDCGLDEAAVEDAWLRSHIGRPLPDVLSDLGVGPAALAGAVACFQAQWARSGPDASLPFPDIVDLLDALDAAGIALALATAKPRMVALAVLERQGLLERFEVVVGANEDESGAEKALVIGAALDALGHPDPATVIMVGDRQHDVEGAMAHGISAVGVTWGMGTADELTAAGARWLVDTPGELRKVLLGPLDVRS